MPKEPYFEDHMPSFKTIEHKISEKLSSRSTKAQPESEVTNVLRHYEARRYKESAKSALEIVKKYPLHPFAWTVVGASLRHAGNTQEALSAYQTALEISPMDVEIQSMVGILLLELNRFEEAEKHLRQALMLNPNDPQGYYNLGLVLKSLDRLHEAKSAYMQAIQLNPDYFKAHNNLGNTLVQLGCLEDAVLSYKKALSIKPDYVVAYRNLGLASVSLKRFSGAMKSYQKALNINPNFVECEWSLSLLKIKLGDFIRGFELYESRYHEDIFNRIAIPPAIDVPRYAGNDFSKDLKDKHLLIITEQGVGDEIMFASVLSELETVVKQNPSTRITIACDPRLINLFNQSFSFLTAVPKDEHNLYQDLEKNLDYWLFIGSLPKIFRKALADFRDHRPYLKPDKTLISNWQRRFEGLPHKINIGISWLGGSQPKNKEDRSLSLEQILPILSTVRKNANIINLQYGSHKTELEDFSQRSGLTIFDWEDCDPLNNLESFSAQIGALDFIISIDNSTVHFAGAIGTPAYVLLPFDQDWRWLENQSDSYWYPSILTLFKQSEAGNWDIPIQNVIEALDKKLRTDYSID